MHNVRATSVLCSALRPKLGHYLDRVESGEVLIILRRGMPIGVLIPPDIFDFIEEEAETALRRRRKRSRK